MAKSDDPVEALILVVEDELIIRMVAVEALIDAGFRVLEAEHGEAAIRVLQDRAKDVAALFTDIQMPGGLDGGGLIRAAAERWPWIRLIAASGNAPPAKAGLPDRCRFVRKPYDVESIVAEIRALLKCD